jgi:membrane dipeptidase
MMKWEFEDRVSRVNSPRVIFCLHRRPGAAMKTVALILAALLVTPAIAEKSKLEDRANELSNKYLLVDTHIDVPYRLEEQWNDVTRSTAEGDFDYPRAVAGGLNVPFMSIYVPASMEESGGGWQLANQLIDGVEALVARAPERFAMAHSTAAVEENFTAGKISLAMGMENGTPIEGKLENLKYFYDRGIRYITLAHSLSNHISDSSYDENRQWGGLSPFGREVVAEMNRLGIMIDVSHLSDDAATQSIEHSQVPVIASHSSVRHFTAGWERNMNDELIKALAAKGGVIHINFGSSFISQQAYDWFATFDKARDAFMAEEQVERDHESVSAFTSSYRETTPYPYATTAQVADHIDHVVKLVGVDYVGIGSDYDGVGNSLPIGLKDVAGYPSLVAELLRREYSENDIAKILGGNLMRVWKAVEAHAAGH